MTHARRPVPAKRIFASLDVHYPTRSSDGEAHVGQMLDLRQLRIANARSEAIDCLIFARHARIHGDANGWERRMELAAQSRKLLAGLKRSGGRVDWRGEPVQDQ